MRLCLPIHAARPFSYSELQEKLSFVECRPGYEFWWVLFFCNRLVRSWFGLGGSFCRSAENMLWFRCPPGKTSLGIYQRGPFWNDYWQQSKFSLERWLSYQSPMEKTRHDGKNKSIFLEQCSKITESKGYRWENSTSQGEHEMWGEL